MSRIGFKRAGFLGCAALLLFLAGCASPSQPSRFYRLESPGTLPQMPQSVLGGEQLSVVGVGPVSLAGYLNRPQIVESQGAHRLSLHEFDRWAGTLQENTLQVLSDVMQDQLPQAQVLPYPWHSRVEPDFEVVLNISQFERQGDRMILRARWTLLGQARGRQIGLGGEGFETRLAGSDMSAMAAAASEALAQLAQRIASELRPLLAPQR
jgi:uncharacterized lipoprotein YmbA